MPRRPWGLGCSEKTLANSKSCVSKNIGDFDLRSSDLLFAPGDEVARRRPWQTASHVSLKILEILI